MYRAVGSRHSLFILCVFRVTDSLLLVMCTMSSLSLFPSQALGLQTCPDGRPKVVDVLDCTGSGDVNTTTVVTPDKESGHLKGLSGRTLSLNSEWSNPSGKWRVGILQGYKVSPFCCRWRKLSVNFIAFSRPKGCARLNTFGRDSAVPGIQLGA